MKQLASTSVEVDCAAASAYALICDMERFGQWFPAVRDVASCDALPAGTPGKTYLETVAIPLRGLRRVQLRVAEALPGRRFVTEGRLAPLWPRMEVALSELGPRRTRIDWAMYSRSRSALVRRLLVPLAGRTVQRRAEIGLARLKEQLEAQRNPP